MIKMSSGIMTRAFPLLLLASAIPITFAADSGNFDILTFNVAGLPAILSSNDVPGDKTTNARTIGSKFAEYDYDVIHVQEVSATGLPVAESAVLQCAEKL
jgi:hypothetical protein